MAIAVKARVLADDILALQARGLVGQVNRTTTVGPFTTTETVLDFITFTAVATATYELWCATWLQSTVANDLVDVRFRYQSGATLTAAGTEFHHLLPNCDAANRGQVLASMRSVTGLSGQYSIGITAVRGGSATGNITSPGSASIVNTLRLYRVAP